MPKGLWPLPDWLKSLPAEEQEAAKVRFYLSMAASYATEDGTLPALSRALGKHDSHMNVARNRGRVSPELAVEIEKLLGRERFPRELFNAVFTVAS